MSDQRQPRQYYEWNNISFLNGRSVLRSKKKNWQHFKPFWFYCIFKFKLLNDIRKCIRKHNELIKSSLIYQRVCTTAQHYYNYHYQHQYYCSKSWTETVKNLYLILQINKKYIHWVCKSISITTYIRTSIKIKLTIHWQKANQRDGG